MLTVLGAMVAVMAAVRSTWSPCGWSMLSTITPLSERGRGHRHAAPRTRFLLGAAVGGTALGAIGAVGAWAVAALDPTPTTLGAIVAVAALVAGAFDADVARPMLPHHRRQVNEEWLDRFRAWVYGSGFGVQIGFGLA